MNIAQIFHWSFWFGVPSVVEGNTRFFWMIVPGIIFLFGIILKYFQSRGINFFSLDKRIVNRLSNISLFVGVGVFLWFFFRQEKIIFLSIRFWLFLLISITIFWLYRIFYYIKKRAPELKRKQFEVQRFRKYLPKSRR